MKTDDILKVARECGNTDTTDTQFLIRKDRLITFARRIAAMQRERCIQICNEIANKPSNVVLGVALECAAAIRRMGDE